MLTQKQIHFYHEQGYLGVENVLPHEIVSELRRVTDDFVEQSRTHTEHTDVFDLEPGHSAADPRLRRLKNPISPKALNNAISAGSGMTAFPMIAISSPVPKNPIVVKVLLYP